MKYLLLNFKEMPTYGWIEYSEEKGLVLSEQEMFGSFLDIKDLVINNTCIVVDTLATDEPTLSISLENILKSNYSITTQKVTNALKKIDSTGKVVSHLNRENYQRLSTPIKQVAVQSLNTLMITLHGILKILKVKQPLL